MHVYTVAKSTAAIFHTVMVTHDTLTGWQMSKRVTQKYYPLLFHSKPRFFLHLWVIKYKHWSFSHLLSPNYRTSQTKRSPSHMHFTKSLHIFCAGKKRISSTFKLPKTTLKIYINMSIFFKLYVWEDLRLLLTTF